MDGLSISVDAIRNQNNQSTAVVNKKDNEVDSQEEFLLLLVTQLKNQDPLSPLEAQEFAVQLAQFSQVERLMNIEKALEISSSSNEQVSLATNKSLAALLIGKTVRSVGNSVVHFEGDSNYLQYQLSEDAENVSAYIKAPDGKIIRTYDFGSVEAGEHTFSWDGKNADGATVASGMYTFEIAAKDAEGAAVALNHFQVGFVEGVRYPEGGVPVLIINGKEVSLSDINEIYGDLTGSSGE